jgi:hypothetical protein
MKKVFANRPRIVGAANPQFPKFHFSGRGDPCPLNERKKFALRNIGHRVAIYFKDRKLYFNLKLNNYL